MPFPVSLCAPTGLALGFAVLRLRDGLLYDFGLGSFVSSPTSLRGTLTESPILPGFYLGTIASTPLAEWPGGEYLAIVGPSAGGVATAVLGATMAAGDSAPVPPVCLPTGSALAGSTATSLVATMGPGTPTDALTFGDRSVLFQPGAANPYARAPIVGYSVNTATTPPTYTFDFAAPGLALTPAAGDSFFIL